VRPRGARCPREADFPRTEIVELEGPGSAAIAYESLAVASVSRSRVASDRRGFHVLVRQCGHSQANVAPVISA
jgi:hypothetical protein